MPQENKKQPDKLPFRKRPKQRKPPILWHFESMDLVNRAMQGTNDLEQMMRDVLDALLSVFECDRAFLVYPCDPEAATWQVPMERVRPEYPGALPIGVEMPLTPAGADVFRILRATKGPVQFGPGLEHEVDPDMQQNFKIQSYIAIALYPKIGSPWSFGLHQCSHARVWTSDEERLFQEIGRRLSDVLTSLLAFRNLTESEKQIKQLIDASPVAMVISSRIEEHVEWVNAKFTELFGYTIEDIPDVAHWWPLAYPDDKYREEVRAMWTARTGQAIRNKSEIEPMEATVRCKDGSYRYIEVRLSSIGQKHLVTFVDLTERKRAEHALYERERHSQSLLRFSQNLERAQTYAEVLRAALNEVKSILGYQNLWVYLFTEDKKHAHALIAKGEESELAIREEIPTLTIQGDRMLEEIAEATHIVVVEDARTDERTNKEIVQSLGVITIVNIPIILFDRHLGSVGTGTFGDEGRRVPTLPEQEYLSGMASHMAVTLDRIRLLNERKQAEEALHEAELLYRRAIESAGTVPYYLDRTTMTYRFLGEGILSLIGYSADETTPQLWSLLEQETVLIGEAAGLDFKEAARRAENGEIAVWKRDILIRARDGQMRWVADSSVQVFNEQGKAVASIGILQDITERKHAEKTLRESEEKYRTLIQKIQAAVVVHGAETQILTSNSMAQELLGLTEDQMLGKTAIDSVWHFFLEDGTPIPIEKYPVNQVLASRKPLRNFTARVHRPTKENDVFVLVNADPVFGKEDEIIQVIVTFIDITEQKQAEEALRKSEWRFREVFDNVLDSLFLLEVTKDGRFRNLEMNPAIEKSTGIPRAHMIGKYIEEVVPEDIASIVNSKYRRCVEAGHPIEEEVELDLPAGRRYFHSTLIPARDETGRVHRIIGITRDITERKQADTQLLASEQLFRALVENSPDFIARYDLEYRRIYVNPAMQRLFGVSTENVLGKTPSEQSPVYAPQVYIEHLRQVIVTGTESATEMPYRTPQGEMHWGHMRFVPEFGPDGSVASVLAIGRDIHEIKENERRFRMLAENFPDLVMRFDRQGRYIYVSPAFEKVFAMPADAVVGKTLQQLPPRIKPEQSDISLEQIRRAFEEGVANDAEVRWETEAGERIFENRYVPEKDAAGSVVTVLCIARDVTERKQMTEALAAREREFRTLAEHSPDNIARYDVNCRTIYVNPTLERTLRRPASEMLGTLPAEVKFIKEGKEFQQKMVEVLKTGKEQEMDVVLPDMGEGVRYHNIRFVAERGADGAVTGLQAIGRDLTERKLAEMALSRERELLRTLVDNLPEEIYVKDRERRFLFVNELLVRALGAQSMDEVIGKRDEDFWPPYLAKQFADEENELMRTGKPLIDEHTPPHKSGPKRWLLRTKLPLRDGAGNIIGLAGLGSDITERKRAEQVVRESEERLRQIASSLREVVWLRDAKTRQVLYVNPAFQELTGRTCESFYENRDAVIDAIHPDDREDVTKALDQRSESVPFDKEHRIIHLNGSVRWVSSKSVAVRNEAGEVYRWATIMEDITERKLAAEALQESEEKYRLLHENAGVGIGYYTPDGRIISYNQLAASHMQGKPEDFEGKSIYDVFPRAEAEFYMGRISKSLETESTLEYEDHLELPSGEKWFLSIFTKISDAHQNVIGVQIISQDITEQKQAEAALRESERRLVAAQRMAHVGYWERDFDSNRVMLSDEACRIFGISEQGLSLTLNEWHPRWVALIHPDDQTRLIELLGDVLAGIRSYDVEYRVIRPDGAVRFIYSQAQVQRDASGHAQNMLGMMQDITERKQAEQELRASENRFRVLSDNAFVGIYIIQDGRLSYCNSTQAKIFGYTPEELIGTDPRLLVHPDDQAMVMENIRRRIDGEIETIHYEFRGRCKDGSTKNIEVLGGRIDFGGKTAVIGNLMDITDRKRAEDEIARSLAAEKKARRVAEILREATESLSRTLYLDDILHKLLEYLLQLIPYDSANVMLLEDEFHLRVVALRGYERWTDLNAARKLVFDIREIPSLHELVTTKQSIQIANTYEYPGWARVAGTEHIVSWLGIPIITDGQVIGLYSVDKVEPAFFSAEDRTLAEGLAAQAAIAIQNRRLHDQITRANVELEQRVADRTAQLEESNSELEAFAYSVSHDLRAPLRHIDGFIELLQKRTKTHLDDKSQHYMDMIGDSAQKMGMLIDDLLSFSRMGRQEIYTSKVDLNDLIQDIMRDSETETKGRKIQWKISRLPLVTGDRAMLRVVLANLIANAVKFTRPTEFAEIEIGYEANESEITLFVRDNGVGFDMKYADKLFGVFQRLHSQEDFEGTGIGLANVHRIIHRHGGRTWAEGQVDHGATFYFSLPTTN